MTDREEILTKMISDAGLDFARLYRREYGVELLPREAIILSLGIIRIFYNHPSIEDMTKSIITAGADEITKIIDSYKNP